MIREPRDQCSFDSSPRLFAAFHALHRLPAPRHPPHALSNLATWIHAPRLDSPTRIAPRQARLRLGEWLPVACDSRRRRASVREKFRPGRNNAFRGKPLPALSSKTKMPLGTIKLSKISRPPVARVRGLWRSQLNRPAEAGSAETDAAAIHLVFAPTSLLEPRIRKLSHTGELRQPGVSLAGEGILLRSIAAVNSPDKFF